MEDGYFGCCGFDSLDDDLIEERTAGVDLLPGPDGNRLVATFKGEVTIDISLLL